MWTTSGVVGCIPSDEPLFADWAFILEIACIFVCISMNEVLAMSRGIMGTNGFARDVVDVLAFHMPVHSLTNCTRMNHPCWTPFSSRSPVRSQVRYLTAFAFPVSMLPGSTLYVNETELRWMSDVGEEVGSGIAGPEVDVDADCGPSSQRTAKPAFTTIIAIVAAFATRLVVT